MSFDFRTTFEALGDGLAPWTVLAVDHSGPVRSRMAEGTKPALPACVTIWVWPGPRRSRWARSGDFSDRSRTDESGEFTLEGVPAGTAYLRIEPRA